MEHLTGGASPESSGDNNTLSNPGGSQRHPTSGSSDNSQLPTRHVGGPVFDTCWQAAMCAWGLFRLIPSTSLCYAAATFDAIQHWWQEATGHRGAGLLGRTIELPPTHGIATIVCSLM